MPTIAPMLAKAVSEVPAHDSVEGGYAFEPKWDGFRAIVHFDGSSVEIDSRGAKPLTRYFPELVDAFARLLPQSCVLDGEIVVRGGVSSGDSGRGERLDWEALSARIHPAESRISKLSRETPAMFVAFDLLGLDGENVAELPFGERRARLETLMRPLGDPLHLTRITTDTDLARNWLVQFEGAGLDGVVAKPLAAAYAPGKRIMLKVKHHRTADVVVLGYRVHKSGAGVGSLLLGLYGADGVLRNVGGASAFSDAVRLELVDELAPLVQHDSSGDVVTGATERSRFSSGKDVSFVRLEPTRVVEVRYDQMEGDRFRHTVQLDRWRPDRDARSCTFEQLEIPVAYDLGKVLV